MKFLILVISVISAAKSVSSFFEWTPVVEIAQGKLRGIALETHNKYLGIPYAKVERRYQAAREAPPWHKTFYAIRDKSCNQVSPILKLPYGTEDCLILNVYSPKHATPERPVPVMVFIHGGGFYYGSSSSIFYGPEFLVQNDVVVVTITYRLGAAGFLCLKTDGAPGNAGLKDQVAALKWVNRNINAFGGDPSSVTLFGESAGASSTHYLILSKMAKGLFHRAILESNTAQSPASFAYDPIVKAVEIAERLGYKTKDLDELEAIYHNTSMTDIVKANDSDELLKKLNFVPCAEKKLANIETFMTETPYEILTSGEYNKVPMIIGHNEREGTLFVGMLKEVEFVKINANLELILPPDLNFKNDERKSAAKVLKEFYFGNTSSEHLEKDHIEEVIDLVSDGFFHYSNVKSSELHLKSSDQPLYNYYFTYDSVRNLGKILSLMSWIRGATHIDETFYIFNPSFRLGPLTGRDLLMAKRMAQLWTNFAKTSNPTPSTSTLITNLWTPSNAQELQFYNLNDDLFMTDLPNPKRINFWRNMYDKYGYKS